MTRQELNAMSIPTPTPRMLSTSDRHRLPLATRVSRGLGHAFMMLYRYLLSPFLVSDCRHLPTCSEYADEAIERFGLWAGGWLVLARLSRCHPFGSSGLDFVPFSLPEHSRWYLPWRYGLWRRANPGPCSDEAHYIAPSKHLL
jgi:putative membrane protein insertion efficiency factor